MTNAQNWIFYFAKSVLGKMAEEKQTLKLEEYC